MLKLLTVLFLFQLFSCQSESAHKAENIYKISLKTPQGATISTEIALTPHQQQQGLSGIQNKDFSDDQGMLFFYKEESEKYFWMPDTYFDLDIFYLDKNFKILDIVRKLPHYKGRNNPELIPRARGIWARHALEMKSGSDIANSLKIGDGLIWSGEPRPEELQKYLEKN